MEEKSLPTSRETGYSAPPLTGQRRGGLVKEVVGPEVSGTMKEVKRNGLGRVFLRGFCPRV